MNQAREVSSSVPCFPSLGNRKTAARLFAGEGTKLSYNL
jgi:hypothetical protein